MVCWKSFEDEQPARGHRTTISSPKEDQKQVISARSPSRSLVGAGGIAEAYTKSGWISTVHCFARVYTPPSSPPHPRDDATRAALQRVRGLETHHVGPCRVLSQVLRRRQTRRIWSPKGAPGRAEAGEETCFLVVVGTLPVSLSRTPSLPRSSRRMPHADMRWRHFPMPPEEGQFVVLLEG